MTSSLLGTLSPSPVVPAAPSESRGAIPQATSRPGLPKACCGIECQALVTREMRDVSND